MWRRVALQSPDTQTTPEQAYTRAWAALNELIRRGESLSGHERNGLFLNLGRGGSEPVFGQAAIAAGFDFDDDSRAICATDWDQDGDLDYWVQNRTAPRLRFYRNTTDTTVAKSIYFRLRGVQGNRDAIGARLILTAGSRKLHRTVKAGEGFLSQSSKGILFGLSGVSEADQQNLTLAIHWPGRWLQPEVLTGLKSGHRYSLTEGTGRAEDLPPRNAVSLQPSKPEVPDWNATARIVLAVRHPLPEIIAQEIQPDSQPVDEPVGTLYTFWSADCPASLRDVKKLASAAQELRAKGLRAVALNVDDLAARPTSDLSSPRSLLTEMKFPLAAAAITPEMAGTLDVFQRGYFGLRLPLPAPASFLVDSLGRLAVIYRQTIDPAQVAADAALLKLSFAERLAHACPLPGRWEQAPAPNSPSGQMLALMRENLLRPAANYGESFLKQAPQLPAEEQPAPASLSRFCNRLADVYRLLGDKARIIGTYRQALQLDPEFVTAHTVLASIAGQDGRLGEAEDHLSIAVRLRPRDAGIQNDLGILRAMQGHMTDAEANFRQALSLKPGFSDAAVNLARCLQQKGDVAEALAVLRPRSDALPVARALISLLLSGPAALRNPVEARTLATRLISGPSPTAEDFEMLAASCTALGDQPAALEALKKALPLASESKRRELQQRLDRLSR